MEAARKLSHTTHPGRRIAKGKPAANSKKALRQPSLHLTLVGLVIGLAVVAVFQVCQRAIIAQESIKISQLHNQLEEVQDKRERLLLETKRLSSPERVARIAVGSLSMIKPGSVRYIYLPDEVQREADSVNGHSGPRTQTLATQAGGAISAVGITGVGVPSGQ